MQEVTDEYPIADYLDYYEYYINAENELGLKRKLYYDFKGCMYSGARVVAENNGDLKELKGRYPHYFKSGLKPIKRKRLKEEFFFIDCDIEDPLKNIDIWNYVCRIAESIIRKSGTHRESILSWIEKRKQSKTRKWRFWK